MPTIYLISITTIYSYPVDIQSVNSIHIPSEMSSSSHQQTFTKRIKLGDDIFLKLLEIGDIEQFNRKYVLHFSDHGNMDLFLLKQGKLCDDPEFLYYWRQAFLEQTIAKNNNAETALLHYQSAIKLLDEMCKKSIDQMTPFKKMLYAHTVSKINYQMGVLTNSIQSHNTPHDSSKEIDSEEEEQAKYNPQDQEEEEQAKYNPQEKDQEEEQEDDSNQEEGQLEYLQYFKMGFKIYDEVVTEFGCANFVQFFKMYKYIPAQLQYFDEYPVQHTYAANMFNFCAYQSDSIDHTDLTCYMEIIDYMMKSTKVINQYDFDFRKKILNFKQTMGLISTRTDSSKKPSAKTLHNKTASINFKLPPLSEVLSRLELTGHELFLREHQQKPFDQILNTLRSDNPRGVCVMPTGSGKTALMARVISILQEHRPGTPIIIIVPSIELIKQTKIKLDEYSSKLTPLQTIQVGSWSSYEIPVLRNVMIITQTSWLKRVKKSMEKIPTSEDYTQELDNMEKTSNSGLSADMYFSPFAQDTLMIVDEAHHLSAKNTARCLSDNFSERPIIGFSATVKDYYLSLPIIVEMSIPECIKNGSISPVQMVNINFSMFQESKQLQRRLKISRGQEDISTEQRQQIDNFMIKTTGINIAVIDIWRQHFQKSHGLTMVFTNGILHSTNLEQIFKECGIRAKAYHSSLHKDIRQQIMTSFRNGDITVIISNGCLDEGVDLPDVKTIIDCSIYVKKERRMYQRIGRGLRGTKQLTYIQVQILMNGCILNPREVLFGNKNTWYLGPDSVPVERLTMVGNVFNQIGTKCITTLHPITISRSELNTSGSDHPIVSEICCKLNGKVDIGATLVKLDTGQTIQSNIAGEIVDINCVIGKKVKPNNTLFTIQKREEINPLPAWISKGSGKQNRHKYLDPPEDDQNDDQPHTLVQPSSMAQPFAMNGHSVLVQPQMKFNLTSFPPELDEPTENDTSDFDFEELFN